jgi:hypothetical protein
MRTKHALKTLPEYFMEVKSGRKTFELRLNDRNFKVGDVLILQEYDSDKDELTNRWIEKEVSYILFGGKFGLQAGHCIMGLCEVRYKI